MDIFGVNNGKFDQKRGNSYDTHLRTADGEFLSVRMFESMQYFGTI